MNKTEKYINLINQVNSLIDNETDFIANLSNIASSIHFTFNFHWTGFYLNNGKELVLGPFQGPIACTRIKYNKGVCGKAFTSAQIINVPDVNEFKGHIACSEHSKSEIVVPVIVDNIVLALIDIDSENYNCFDDTDEHYLAIISKNISKIFKTTEH
ncbi:MAG: GAF domain-containing protein [Bacteroidetes bacterium]|nr:GAF domain-containing protein [Bacteroidota bacterium]